MATVFLVMMSWMTIIVNFALINLNTSDLCSCFHSVGGFFVLTWHSASYTTGPPSHIFPDFPETSPFSDLLPCSLENFLSCTNCSASDESVSVCAILTLAWVFHNLQKWNLIVDSGISPDDALSVYGLRGRYQHWELLKFIAELPVWIIYVLGVLKRCLSFYTCILLTQIY